MYLPNCLFKAVTRKPESDPQLYTSSFTGKYSGCEKKHTLKEFLIENTVKVWAKLYAMIVFHCNFSSSFPKVVWITQFLLLPVQTWWDSFWTLSVRNFQILNFPWETTIQFLCLLAQLVVICVQSKISKYKVLIFQIFSAVMQPATAKRMSTKFAKACPTRTPTVNWPSAPWSSSATRRGSCPCGGRRQAGMRRSWSSGTTMSSWYTDQMIGGAIAL